jgi:hypothetical protein
MVTIQCPYRVRSGNSTYCMKGKINQNDCLNCHESCKSVIETTQTNDISNTNQDTTQIFLWN